jgi:hypothetical protein
MIFRSEKAIESITGRKGVGLTIIPVFRILACKIRV